MSRQRRSDEAAIESAIEAAGRPLRPGGIIASTGLGRKTVIKTLRRMEAAGRVRGVGGVSGTEYEVDR